MPIKSVKLIPGVNVERTPTLNEAGISLSAFGRFRDGLYQKIGGWVSYISLLSGVPRDLHVWQDLNAQARLAVGTTTSFAVSTNQSTSYLTPRTRTTNMGPHYIQTTAGSASVLMRDDNLSSAPAAYLTTADGVYLNTPISVGGIILSGFYPITAIGATENLYYITAADAATSTSSFSASVVTITIATPAVVTWAAHGLAAGTPVQFSTTGALPTGLSSTATYYVSATGLTANTFQVADYPGGTSVNTSGSQSGTHSCTAQAGVVPAFSTVSGSSIVTVTFPDHGLAVGDGFVLPITTTVSSIALQGQYNVTEVVNASQFKIATATVATATTTYAVPMNSNIFQFEYYISIGPQAAGSGYGSGAYGSGSYGYGLVPATQTGSPITTNHWTIDNWGQDVVACPESGAIYYWSPTGGYTTLTQVLTAPIFNEGIFVSMPQRIMVAYGSTVTNAIGVQQDPLLVRWSAVEDFTTWIATAENQAGSYRIPTGSRIVGGLQGPVKGLIWTDLDVWAMNYIGYPYTFGFDKLGANCGLIGIAAACQLRGIVYWMGQSNFFYTSGSGVEIINCSVWDYVFQNLDVANAAKCVAAANTAFNEVAWYFPRIGGSGEPDTYVKYNVTERSWDFGSLSRTAWTDQSALGGPMGASAQSVVYEHEDGYNADGLAINASMTTGYFAINEAHEKAFVDLVWPDFKYGTYSGAQNARILVSFLCADYPTDVPVVYGPYVVTSTTTQINVRLRTRLMALRIESGDLDSFWRIGNIRLRYAEDGKV